MNGEAVSKQKKGKSYSVAYLDCFSGVSGDMLLGAFIDAGMEFEVLKEAVSLLPLEGFSIHLGHEKRCGIIGTRLRVDVKEGVQQARGLYEIKDLIGASGLAEEIKAHSISIFELLAQAEAKVHGLTPEQVHFHEVGAVDSIVDIVGVCVSVHHMNIQSIYASPLPLGKGFVKSAHGTLPIPAPATLELLKGVPIEGTGLPYELVTPTGAAIVKHFVKTFGPMPSMVVEESGWGAGQRDLPDRPNLLRVLLGGQGVEQAVSQEIVAMLETNIDDVTPEILGHLMDTLFEAGALDVAFLPIQMKKNRPASQVQVMAPPHLVDSLVEVIFVETHTLGIRVSHIGRRVLKRELITVESPWGEMVAKRITLPNGSNILKPEYRACKHLALKAQTPLREVMDWVSSLNYCCQPKRADRENG